MDPTLNAYLEVEEYCEQTEEDSHGGETKYQQGFPPNPLYHQALRKEEYNCDFNSLSSVNEKKTGAWSTKFNFIPRIHVLTYEYMETDVKIIDTLL